MSNDAQRDDAVRQSVHRAHDAAPQTLPRGSSTAWSALGSVTAAPPEARAASAIGTLVDGPVRVIVVARSTYAEHARVEAERAVTVALAAARTMLGATARDLDATHAALPRGIVNRWRSTRPADLPAVPGGQGTSVLVALASGASARLTGWGFGRAFALGPGETIRPLDLAPDHTVAPSDLAATAPHPAAADSPEPGVLDAHALTPESLDADSLDAEPLLPLGLDVPSAGAHVVQRRLAASEQLRLLWLSVGPESTESSALWAAALAEVADRLAAQTADTTSASAADSGEDSEDPSDPDDLSPVPEWLPGLLPTGMSAVALAWPDVPLAAAMGPGEGTPNTARASAAVGRKPAAGSRSSAEPSTSSVRGAAGGMSSGAARRRWSLVLLALALLAGLAVAAWAWSRALDTEANPAPSGTPSVVTRPTPTMSASTSSPGATPSRSQPPTATASDSPAPPRAVPANTQRYIPPARPVTTSPPTTTTPTSPATTATESTSAPASSSSSSSTTSTATATDTTDPTGGTGTPTTTTP